MGLVAAAEDSATQRGTKGDEVRGHLTRLLRDLDSDRFEIRRQAAGELRKLAARHELGNLLAAEFHRLRVSPQTSLEVRKELEVLSALIPASQALEPGRASPEEIGRLVRQLDDEAYATRLGAAKRLEWLLGEPKAVVPILVTLKRRMDAEPLAPDARRWLEPIYALARYRWLTSDPAGWDLPPVSSAEMATWFDDLERPGAEPGHADREQRGDRAFRELRDLMARDEYIPTIHAMARARLERKGVDPRASRRLQELVALTPRAMVAEFWFGGRLLNTQHLTVGVPSLGPNADRPSHFDRIDDRTAHCVSGQNLSSGDYPVGVAVPHPKQPGALFHLVNLTTPRHKMAYAILVGKDQKKRLAEISRRTLDYLLALKRPWTPGELGLVGQLDAAEFSRGAGRLLEMLDDGPVPEEVQAQAVLWHVVPLMEVRGPDLRASPRARLGRRGWICLLLAANGTREAMPGLLKAIEAKRFQPPTAESPLRLEWIAALAIAERDPWAEADPWLAGLVGRDDELIAGQRNAPQLGATAAALLLTRNRKEPSQFGVVPADDEILPTVRLAGFRFSSPEAPAKVERWWKEYRMRAEQGQVLP